MFAPGRANLSFAAAAIAVGVAIIGIIKEARP